MKRSFVASIITLVILLLFFANCKLFIKKQKIPINKKAISRFVFLGDSRGNYKANPPVHLAEKKLKIFTNLILNLNPKPDFVIFNGDMLAKTAYRSSPESIKKWKSIFMKPLKKKGIKLYINPGNHIVDQKNKETGNTLTYIKRFKDIYPTDNPLNGPVAYKGISFSFDVAGVHFATVSSFVTHSGFDNTEIKADSFIQKKKEFEYFINKTNRDWLLQDLNNSKSNFKIVFTHCSIFPAGPHLKDKKNLNAHPENVVAVSKILSGQNIKLYLVSHEHVYARNNVSSSNPPESTLENEFPMVLIGSAGAPLSKGKKRNDMNFEKYLETSTMMVADIEKSQISFHVIDDEGSIVDKFNLKRNK